MHTPRLGSKISICRIDLANVRVANEIIAAGPTGTQVLTQSKRDSKHC